MQGCRLLQEIHDDIPLTYVYSDSQSYEPLARIDGVESPEIFLVPLRRKWDARATDRR